jgi:hypothetical protein
MSADAAFLARLSAAVQQQHEATMHLQQLASELVDHCSRMRGFTDRLHVMARQDVMLEAPREEPLLVPKFMKNGPILGER